MVNYSFLSGIPFIQSSQISYKTMRVFFDTNFKKLGFSLSAFQAMLLRGALFLLIFVIIFYPILLPYFFLDKDGFSWSKTHWAIKAFLLAFLVIWGIFAYEFIWGHFETWEPSGVPGGWEDDFPYE